MKTMWLKDEVYRCLAYIMAANTVVDANCVLTAAVAIGNLSSTPDVTQLCA